MEWTAMPWRVIATDGAVWHVQAAAERRANERLWQLMLSFRAAGEGQRRSVWAPYPIEAVSKSSLFLQADRLSDEDLRAVITQHIS
jgi:hypothetical protein